MSDKSTALMTPDDALIKQWQDTKTGEDASGGQKLPILKILQPPTDCKHGAGSWVIGLKKDSDDNIEDHGHKIKGVVILAVRNRYSYYDQSNPTLNCATPLFNSFDEAVGSKHKYNCADKTCPYRMKEGNPKCRAQKVAFGVAITEDNQLVDCVAYIQGSSYMPFSNYVSGMKQVRTKGGYVEAPTYAFLTLLDTEKKKNGAVTYFEGVFKRGPMWPGEKYQYFHGKHLEAIGYIENVNKASVARATDQAPHGADQPANGSQANKPDDLPPIVLPRAAKRDDDDVIDIPPTLPTELPQDDDIPFDLGNGSVSGSDDAAEPAPEDFDIEAAIQNALKA